MRRDRRDCVLRSVTAQGVSAIAFDKVTVATRFCQRQFAFAIRLFEIFHPLPNKGGTSFTRRRGCLRNSAQPAEAADVLVGECQPMYAGHQIDCLTGPYPHHAPISTDFVRW